MDIIAVPSLSWYARCLSIVPHHRAQPSSGLPRHRRPPSPRPPRRGCRQPRPRPRHQHTQGSGTALRAHGLVRQGYSCLPYMHVHRVHAVAFCPFLLPPPEQEASDSNTPSAPLEECTTDASMSPHVPPDAKPSQDDVEPDRVVLVSVGADRCLCVWRVVPSPSRVRHFRLKSGQTVNALCHARCVVELTNTHCCMTKPINNVRHCTQA